MSNELDELHAEIQSLKESKVQGSQTIDELGREADRRREQLREIERRRGLRARARGCLLPLVVLAAMVAYCKIVEKDDVVLEKTMHPPSASFRPTTLLLITSKPAGATVTFAGAAAPKKLHGEGNKTPLVFEANSGEHVVTVSIEGKTKTRKLRVVEEGLHWHAELY